MFTKIFKFYLDGFRTMSLGRRLWAIIIIKLAVILGVLKLFIYDESLNTKFKTDAQKGDFVLESLTKDR
ncbi:DUF4492 domain-containing protein [Campylobacter sp. 19-13652]|uniref:DUF4492 domain-containing protein n=1 Tax=Campylobacter sp. 19-13652 TaxID=2840180 RepID=UPI001C75C617|nr:DUF4492 domain-containing protein [Campylobacter sp. 19-13652]BCX80262.1 hypothetical protein LBC_17240 [Campylobacter sp. 19-13652]